MTVLNFYEQKMYGVCLKLHKSCDLISYIHLFHITLLTGMKFTTET